MTRGHRSNRKTTSVKCSMAAKASSYRARPARLPDWLFSAASRAELEDVNAVRSYGLAMHALACALMAKERGQRIGLGPGSDRRVTGRRNRAITEQAGPLTLCRGGHMSAESPVPPQGSWMTLAQAIGGIRDELTEAMLSATDEQLRFDVGDVELEFTVDVRRDRQARAGVRVWVAELGGDMGVSRESASRIKLTLHPVDTASGLEPRVADHVEVLPPRRE